MFQYKTIKIGKHSFEAFLVPLGKKNLILFKGTKGYCMCGYLNLNAARCFGDAAIKITGVSSIKEALQAKVSSCTQAARSLGVYRGQPVKEALLSIC